MTEEITEKSKDKTERRRNPMYRGGPSAVGTAGKTKIEVVEYSAWFGDKRALITSRSRWIYGKRK